MQCSHTLTIGFDFSVCFFFHLRAVCLWYAFFLLNGVLLPEEDLIWPFKMFYWVTPFSYYIRSCMYEQLSIATFEPCLEFGQSVVCTPGTSGLMVLDQLTKISDVFSTTQSFFLDSSALLAMGAFLKLVYMVGVHRTTTKTMVFTSTATSTVKDPTNRGGVSETSRTMSNWSVDTIEQGNFGTVQQNNDEEKWCRVSL